MGEVSATLEEVNHRKLALGTHSRSGDQWDIWQAVFGPVGPDGYPALIWDKLTGEIDRKVAESWKQNYDLRYILERDWKTLGPKLRGKIHIYVGDMDQRSWSSWGGDDRLCALHERRRPGADPRVCYDGSHQPTDDRQSLMVLSGLFRLSLTFDHPRLYLVSSPAEEHG